ncbi:REC domain-containing phosphodiesterase [Exilibacterium tricleocarpae]|uniref:REC domain-containing phosphodiesterase n=1 Tax=Exilibacterium tricleocarpae TaxID=2591008 RepID=A0A545TFK0_9GAMM|nr:response regulator [Exilibacterium tricleocarpae]TQV76007.1 REC domain-containing phosphodiesterase [Exilibacterium tricleocarpae]
MNNTLLLVDDDTAVRKAMRRSLRDEGYRILEADCGESALEVLAARTVDVIVTDQRMPQMSGIDLLCLARQSYPDTARIMVSGYSDFDTLTRAVNDAELFRFLSKPWRDDELKKLIRLSLLPLQSLPSLPSLQHAEVREDDIESTAKLLTKPALIAHIDRSMRTGSSVQLPPQVLTLEFTIRTPAASQLQPGVFSPLLHHIVDRLRQYLPPGAPLARTGHRRFTTALFEHTDNTSLTHQALKVERAFLCPFTFKGMDIAIDWHMGGCSPGTAVSAEKMLANAEAALDSSRHNGNLFECDDQAGVQWCHKQAVLAAQFHKAIRADQVNVQYQPVIDAAGGRISIVESLLHWPDCSETGQDDLFKLTDLCGTHQVLCPWYLCNAYAQLSRWRRRGCNQIRLLQRLSDRMLATPSTPVIIQQAAHSFGVPTQALILTFTEAGLRQATKKIRHNLMVMHRLGIKLCIDGFDGKSSDSGLFEILPISYLRLHRNLHPTGESARQTVEVARQNGAKIIISDIDTPHPPPEWLAIGDYFQGEALGSIGSSVQIERQLPRLFDLTKQ